MRLFDIEDAFGEDYLYFYGPWLTPERNRADTDRVVEVLALEPGERVLDVPCGHGRISNALAERGMAVTGIDATPRFIEMAREDAAARGVEVQYEVGEMVDLGEREPFDAVVCWFTSFGYLEDAGNHRVLGEFARVLRPGGRLGIEMQHHDGFVRRYTAAPFASTVYRGDDMMLDTSSFDPVTGRAITERVVHRAGEVRRTRHQVRLPTIPELDVWLSEAGFTGRRFLGEGGDPPTVEDFRIVAVATR